MPDKRPKFLSRIEFTVSFLDGVQYPSKNTERATVHFFATSTS